MRMIPIVMVALFLVTVVTMCIWSAFEVWKAADAAKSPEKKTGEVASAPKPETLEGALVRQLFDHEINGPQYLHAMERLAERDADRHPLSVPGDD
jgi:hypothetical protein